MIVHAVGESLTGPHDPATYAVVLAARDEADIERIAAFLEGRGVALARVTEPDPPWGGALMALGLAPRPKNELRRHVSHLRLLA
jgi:hypothetical protein